MTLKTIAFAALVATTALAGVASAQVEFNKDEVCAKQREANEVALTATRAARPDTVAMTALINEAVKREVGNNICLADLLGEGDADIAAILGQLASNPDEDIAPAAGPDGETPEFGGGTGPTGENPGQLNTPTTGGPASPSAPADFKADTRS